MVGGEGLNAGPGWVIGDRSKRAVSLEARDTHFRRAQLSCRSCLENVVPCLAVVQWFDKEFVRVTISIQNLTCVEESLSQA